MSRIVALLLVVFSLTGTVVAAEVGRLGAEVPDQIGVHAVTLEPGSDLQKGDVLAVQRAGKQEGEATVLLVEGARGRVALRGSLVGIPGDVLVFLRRPSAVSPVSTGVRPARSMSEPAAAPLPKRRLSWGITPWYIPQGLSTRGKSPVPQSGGKSQLALVSSAAECGAIMNEALAALDRHFGIRITVLPVKTEYRPGGWDAARSLGMRGGVVGYPADHYRMTIAGDFPREDTFGVLAHELTHCWLRETPYRMDFGTAENEGFCMWVELKILLREGYYGTARKLLRDLGRMPPEYSSGFQRFAEMENEYGEIGVLNYGYYGDPRGLVEP